MESSASLQARFVAVMLPWYLPMTKRAPAKSAIVCFTFAIKCSWSYLVGKSEKRRGLASQGRSCHLVRRIHMAAAHLNLPYRFCLLFVVFLTSAIEANPVSLPFFEGFNIPTYDDITTYPNLPFDDGESGLAPSYV